MFTTTLVLFIYSVFVQVSFPFCVTMNGGEQSRPEVLLSGSNTALIKAYKRPVYQQGEQKIRVYGK